MTRIESELKANGPMLSGELCQLLSKKYNMTNEASRKAISRASFPVKKHRMFPFRNNQSFVFLDNQYNTSQYKKGLYDALKSDSQGLACILTALENNGGMMSKDLLPAFSNSPEKRMKGHILFSRNINSLIDSGIITETDEYYELSSSYSSIKPNLDDARANELLYKIVAHDFVDLAKKLNVVSYNKIAAYPQKTSFAQFLWAFSGPSYIYPFVKYATMGFIVGDVVLKRGAGIEDVRFFIDKINTIVNMKRIYPFAPILLIDFVSKEAFEYLKQRKVMVFSINHLFSEEYEKALIEIHHVLTNALKVIKHSPEKIDSLLKSISKIEGGMNNVKGALFEHMVGSLQYHIGVERLMMNTRVRSDNGKVFEMDVAFTRGDVFYVIECKAYKSSLEKQYVEKWFSEAIPCFREWILTHYPNYKIQFELWSLGGFTKEAKEFFETHKVRPTKYTVKHLDQKQINDYAKKNGGSKFIEQLAEYYKDYGKN